MKNVVLLILLPLLGAGIVLADESDPRANILRTITNQASPSIVEFKGTLTLNFGGQGQEQETKGRGLVIDPSGIVVCSKFNLDLGNSIKFQGLEITATMDPRSLRVITADGTSYEAEILTHDKQLDLAFLRVKPKEGETFNVPALSFEDRGTVQLGDEVIAVGRSEEKYSYAPGCQFGRIQWVVEKPRRFFISEGIKVRTIAGPVYTMDGKLVGLVTIPELEGEEIARLFQSQSPDAMQPIILPVDEFLAAWDSAKASLAEDEEE